jgi:hypothetical protein
VQRRGEVRRRAAASARSLLFCGFLRTRGQTRLYFPALSGDGPAGAASGADRIRACSARRPAASDALVVCFHRFAAAGMARGACNPEEFMSASPAERKAGPVSIVRIEAAINAWREVYPPAPDGEDGYALDAGSNCLAELYGTMICYRLPDVPLDSLSDEQRDALYATEV